MAQGQQLAETDNGAGEVASGLTMFLAEKYDMLDRGAIWQAVMNNAKVRHINMRLLKLNSQDPENLARILLEGLIKDGSKLDGWFMWTVEYIKELRRGDQ